MKETIGRGCWAKSLAKSLLMQGCLGLTCCLLALNSANGEIYINEIFSDPGGAGLDDRDAFVELRGTPEMSLANHFLLIVEAEDTQAHTGTTGLIENLFVLGDDPITPAVETPYTLGTNGFLTFRQKGNVYAAPAAGTTDLVNSGGGPGFGSNGTGGLGTSIRARDIGNQGEFEGGGYTVMLVRNDGANAPELSIDLDVGNNGLDNLVTNNGDYWKIVNPSLGRDWTILDSVGFYGEYGEALYGRLYGKVNFGQEKIGEPIDVGLPNPIIYSSPNIEAGATYLGLGYEIEYVGRWGNSTGSTAQDWHISNLTDNALSGSAGVQDWRQSGGFHDMNGRDNYVETSQGVAYGTPITNTLGAPNLFYLDGDFDLDGDVDGRDLMIWQRNYGYGDGLALGGEVTALRTHGDTNGDWKVDGLDLADWQANYGSGGSLAASTTAVPEPATIAIIMPLGYLLIRHRRHG
jgi:hypothetical protein